MRILIIGGTSFMGPAVVSALLQQGHEITLFHRGETQVALPPEVQHIYGDRAHLADFRGNFQHLAPDVVLDMILFTEEEARMLVQTLVGVTARIVVVSSQDVYRAYGRLLRIEPGEPDPVPLVESSPLREKLYPYRGTTPRQADDPKRWYDDYDKILVERTIMHHEEIAGTILRLPAVYGPSDAQHRVFEYLKYMDDRRPAILLGEQMARWRWTRGYVENVAAAIALAVTDERAAGRVYNVGEAQSFTIAEWIALIACAAGWQGEVVTVPEEQLPAHLQSELDLRQSLVTDTSLIRNELGYHEPVTLDEAYQRSVAWERAHPPAKIDPTRYAYDEEDRIVALLKK